MSNIYDAIQIRKVGFQNRIVMAPMVRFGFDCNNGIMGEELQNEYLSYSDKEIGLIISQVLNVSTDQPLWNGASVYDEQHIGYLKKITDKYKNSGTRFFAQLGLPGYAFHDNNSKNVNDLTTSDLTQIKDDFVNAAYLCKKAGVDGIELHGAHTFFLNMITSDLSNNRTDAYGGNLMRRLALVKEITDAIKQFSGDHFLVSYRMGWCKDLNTDVKTAQVLADMGIDMLHISTGIPESRQLQLPPKFPFNDVVFTGVYVKKHVRIPVVSVNNIKTIGRGNQLIKQSDTDFVAYGKPFLADTDFVIKSFDNSNYKPCIDCKKCQWFTNGVNCPVRKKLNRGGI